MADRPITQGGGPGMVLVHLPTSVTPGAGAGDFLVKLDDPNVPFERLVIRGPQGLGELEVQPDGSIVWPISREWSTTIE